MFDGVNDRANFLVGNQSEFRVRRDVVDDPAEPGLCGVGVWGGGMYGSRL